MFAYTLVLAVGLRSCADFRVPTRAFHSSGARLFFLGAGGGSLGAGFQREWADQFVLVVRAVLGTFVQSFFQDVRGDV